MEPVKISGFAVLFIGVAVLLFTFWNAYQFLLVAKLPATGGDLMATFGYVLVPLIETCLKAIYLGIMGWIGSILTRRGVQTITIEKEEKKPKKTEEAKEVREAEKPEAEAKSQAKTEAKQTEERKG